MSRPKTNALSYYPEDIKESDREQYVEAIHGLIGYAILRKLRKHIYGCSQGYYCEWSEINQRLFCKHNGITMDQLQDIMKSCFLSEISLFDKKMYEEHKILTSEGIQKRWKKIVTEAGRKNTLINPSYCLLIVVETAPPLHLPDSNQAVTQPESTQSKVKESKEEKSKVTTLTDSNTLKKASPATANAVTGGKHERHGKKEKDKPRPHWQRMVDTWFEFYKKKFGDEEPNFESRNAGTFGKIVDLLALRAKKKRAEWSEEYAAGALKFFLELAIKDQWLKEHFLLANLHEQFDAVFARAQKNKPVVSKKSFDDELKYLVGRYIDGDFDSRVINADHYDTMVVRNIIPKNYCEEFEGQSIEQKKISAVMRWIQIQTESMAVTN